VKIGKEIASFDEVQSINDQYLVINILITYLVL
jgi:hypothetical protein